jgi:hypothetical protein
MSRFFSFVAKANQVLFLLVLIGVAILVTTFFIDEYSNNRTRNVPIVDAAKPESSVENSPASVIFLGKTDAAYVIGIIRPEVIRHRDAPRLLSSKSKDFEGELVNVHFVTPTGVAVPLLKTDGLVLSHVLSPSNYEKDELNICLFRCVTDDTDGNRVLNEEDRVDLHLTSIDGSTAPLVIKSAVDYDVVSNTELVVTTRDAQGIEILSVDTRTLTVHSVKRTN